MAFVLETNECVKQLLTLLPLSYCQLNLIKISCFIVLPLFESGSVSEQLILIKLLSTQHMDS